MRRQPLWKSPLFCWLLLGAWTSLSMGLAIALYPKPYSWQHTVMSTLASPRDNPRSYWIACISLAGTGLLYLPFGAFLRDRLAASAPRLAGLGGWCLRLGAALLISTAIIVPGHYRLLGVSRMHERLAQASGLAFSLALVFYFAALLRMPGRAWLKVVAGVVTILPLTLFVANRAAGWAEGLLGRTARYHAMQQAAWNDLAMWEWLGAASVYSFLGLIVLFVAVEKTGGDPRTSRDGVNSSLDNIGRADGSI